MNEQIQTEGFSLLELLKLLWSKAKLLILVLICGGIIGGAFGVVTTINENYYGTSLEFYVNPTRPEKDENSEITAGGSTYGVYGAYGRHVMDNIVKLLSSELFAEKLLAEMPNAPEEKLLIKQDGSTTINPAYKSYLQKIRSAVVFKYLDEEVDSEDAVNLARSFIYVDISVLGDENKQFAVDLMNCITKIVPQFVEENMIIPDGYIGTKCIQITTVSEIGLTNPKHTTKSAIKNGLLFGALSLVVACIFVVVIDRSDKRVRDYELVARQLKVPLLGVVPTINDEKIAAWNEARKEAMGE